MIFSKGKKRLLSKSLRQVFNGTSWQLLNLLLTEKKAFSALL
jgi:hypothetical protein